MIDNIIKSQRSAGNCYQFSILIPTWNNLGFLKKCIESINRNSYYQNQIIVVVNEGTDGSADWIERKYEIDYVYSSRNLGVSYALNAARSLIKSDYVIVMNDNAYVLPRWDMELYKGIMLIGKKEFLLTGTIISWKPCYDSSALLRDYGTSYYDFDEKKLLLEYASLITQDRDNSRSVPFVIHIDLWDLIGGMDVDHLHYAFPDERMCRKLYDAGVRIFRGKGSSLVYCFNPPGRPGIFKKLVSRLGSFARENNVKKQKIQYL